MLWLLLGGLITFIVGTQIDPETTGAVTAYLVVYALPIIGGVAVLTSIAARIFVVTWIGNRHA